MLKSDYLKTLLSILFIYNGKKLQVTVARLIRKIDEKDHEADVYMEKFLDTITCDRPTRFSLTCALTIHEMANEFSNYYNNYYLFFICIYLYLFLIIILCNIVIILFINLI